MKTVAPTSFTSFNGCKRIAFGNLETNALAVKRAIESGSSCSILTFNDDTGCALVLDTRGTDAETLVRLNQESPSQEVMESESVEVDQSSFLQRGRGRKKLGVIAREITLLTRHRDWLLAQPGGVSVALRKLVEAAKKDTATSQVKRRSQERAYQFMSAMASYVTSLEESRRALFAGDFTKFLQLTAEWPSDVQDYALGLASYEKT